MLVRPYKKEDRAACIEIFRSNTPFYFADIELPYYEHWLDGQGEGQLAYDETSAEHYYVIHHDGRILACGGFYIPKGERRANMVWGMVDSSLHKKGIGRQFLEYRIAQIQSLYPGYIISLDTTQHTYKFFEKLGFTVTTITPDHYTKGLHRYDMIK
jgi:[ribosomal protein S18]-alanine N-acetyltransferase